MIKIIYNKNIGIIWNNPTKTHKTFILVRIINKMVNFKTSLASFKLLSINKKEIH